VVSLVVAPRGRFGSETEMEEGDCCNVVSPQKVMRNIYGPIKSQDGCWRIRANEEIDLIIIRHADMVRYLT
jgi:hypothetical protein